MGTVQSCEAAPKPAPTPAPTPKPRTTPAPTPRQTLTPTLASAPNPTSRPTPTPTPRPPSERSVRKAKFKGLVLVVPYRRGKVDLAQVLKAFARCQKEKKGKKGKCTSESVKHEPKIGKGRTKKTGKSK